MGSSAINITNSKEKELHELTEFALLNSESTSGKEKIDVLGSSFRKPHCPAGSKNLADSSKLSDGSYTIVGSLSSQQEIRTRRWANMQHKGNNI